MWFTKKEHSENTKSLIRAAFPERLRDEASVALAGAGIAAHQPFVDANHQVFGDGELVAIPYRVYFPPASIAGIGGLTAPQHTIFALFMTRRHDGHQREYWARILTANPSSWTAPCLAALLGDYVIQVSEVVRESLTDEWKPVMARYAVENQVSLRSLNHRILNHRAISHRYFSPNIRNLTEYPGYLVAGHLGLWDRRTAPKLVRKAKANKARTDNPH